MKNLKYITLCSAMTVAFISCDKTDEMSSNVCGNVTTIIANINGTSDNSRTAIDPTTYTGGHVGILWMPGDAIGVYSNGVNNKKFTSNSTQPLGRTTFTGDCDAPLLAYYPYSPDNDACQSTAVKGALPSVQHYDSQTRRIEGDYKYGIPREGADNEFDFNHIFSLLCVNVNVTGTTIENETLRSVTIELPSQRVLAGDFTFDLNNGKYSFTGDMSNSVTLLWTDTPKLEPGKTYSAYMTCAPDFKEDDEVKIIVTTDKHTATVTKHIAYDFESNSVYTFNVDLSLFGDDVVIDEIPVEPEEETANCYMVTSAGVHDFKATVIGNGQKGIIPGAGFHTDDATITPRSASLLWEDVQGFISDIELRDGRVYYTTTGNVGNAVIAVYSGADATGDILWSWHIWGVGDTLPNDVELTNYKGHRYTVMSRNLGDRSDKSAYGVMYQWGRKDPVSSDSIIYVNGQEITTDDAATRCYRFINRFTSADRGKATIEYGVRNPMQMTTIESCDDWLNIENLYLWGNTNFAVEQASDEKSFTDVKTIYDPSPVGYRVANSQTFTYFVKNENGSNTSAVNAARLDRLNYIKYDNGYYFMANESDTEGIWFPQNGARDGYYLPVTIYTGNGNKRAYFSSVTKTGRYWYSNPADPKSGERRALCISMSSYVENNNSNISNSYNQVQVNNILKRSSALAVRCVRE